jgi:hemoglobin
MAGEGLELPLRGAGTDGTRSAVGLDASKRASEGASGGAGTGTPVPPGVAAGVTEADIRRLVVAFYTAACADEMIGPIFERVVHDWESHYDTLTDFWSAMVLGTRRYSGRPAASHMPLDLTRPHFNRWAAIWAEVAQRELGDAKAEPFIDLGGKMAMSMSRWAPRH